MTADQVDAENQSVAFEVVPGWKSYDEPGKAPRYWQRDDGNAEVMQRAPMEFEVNTWRAFKTGRGRMQRMGSYPTLRGAFMGADDFCPPESQQ